MKKVYYDVENTLEVPFITGIQRVIREISKIVLRRKDGRYEFVPIKFDYRRSCWRTLTNKEKKNLINDTPRKLNITSRVIRRIRDHLPYNRQLYIIDFQNDSLFMDVDSSWHNKLARSTLLPALKSSGAQIIKLHHDIIPLLFPKMTHPATVKVFKNHFLSHLEYSDLFLCNSETTRNDVDNYCAANTLKHPQMRTIRLGAIVPDRREADLESNSRIRSIGNFILCVGTIEPRKNHQCLLQAFDLITEKTDLNLVIVGRTGWLSEKVIDSILKHPLADSRIFYFDAVTDSELEEVYRAAWISVMPSLYEGYGLPVLEALIRGTPSLCSNAKAMQEVAGPYARYFDAQKPDQLAAILLELYCNPNSYETLKLAAENFSGPSWYDTVSDIEVAFDELL